MERRFFNIFAGFSLLLFLVSAAFWVRSYFVGDGLFWGTGPYANAAVKEIHVKFSQGRIGVGDYRFELFRLDGRPVTAADYAAWNSRPNVRRWEWWRSPWHRPEVSLRSLWNFEYHLRYHPPVVEGGLRAEEVWRSAECPFWVPVVAAGMLPVWWLLLGRRKQRQQDWLAHGLCGKCGYDLRAHRPGQKCPECGTMIPAGSGGAHATNPSFCCPRCGGAKHSVWRLPNVGLLHWIINPGLVVNELLLGQRIPRAFYFCQRCPGSLFGRQYVYCPSCQRFYHGLIWARGNAFGHRLGLVCPDCSRPMPALRNLTAWLVLVVTAPLWWPVLRPFRSSYLRWEQERAVRRYRLRYPVMSAATICVLTNPARNARSAGR